MRNVNANASLIKSLAISLAVTVLLSLIMHVQPSGAFSLPMSSQNTRMTHHHRQHQHQRHRKTNYNVMMLMAAAAASTTNTVEETTHVVATRRICKVDDRDHAGERFRGFAAITPMASVPTDSTTTTTATVATTDVTSKLTTKQSTTPKTRLKKQAIKRRTTALAPKMHGTATAQSARSARSSTMPGFSIPSQRQQAQVRMLHQIEDPTEDYGPTMTSRAAAVALHTRHRQTAGDAMYQSSSSVPDSLMQFAKELHQVSCCLLFIMFRFLPLPHLPTFSCSLMPSLHLHTQEERITPTEEIKLGRLTQEAIQLQSLYDDMVTKLQREPTDDEWCAASGKINMEAIRQALEQGIEAKNKLVTSNLRLVQGVVNVYIRNGLSGQYNAGDMMQEGVMVS